MSPELFLEADMTSGHIVTRPVKGTRPATGSAAELLAYGTAVVLENEPE